MSAVDTRPGMPRRSIQDKLVYGSVALLAAALLGLLAAVIWINLSLSQRHKASVVQGIRQALLAKGNILVSNNSLALEEMVADNAFIAVATVVSSTVRDDEDVVYGIYMAQGMQPWVNAHPGNPKGMVNGAMILDDSASLWASKVEETSHHTFRPAGEEVIEFAAPVRVEGQIQGFIRYGLTTARMNAAILEANRSARQALLRTIIALLSLGAAAMVLAFLAARRQAARLTRPIHELQAAAGAIDKGDYGLSVEVSADDEIGLLAADFDTMRRTVKDYTERLEDMVAEKIQEIKDILDNIEQGLFTVGMDGKVNPDYALSTNSILRVPDVASRPLGDLFRVDQERLDEWMGWLDMVRQKHATMRWEKLARLAPIQELRIKGEDGEDRFIQIGYQRMYDRSKRLAKLMILAQDVTEARRIERMIREEKERHENEVKAILGIVRNANSMPEFLEDAGSRLRNLERLTGELIAGMGAPDGAASGPGDGGGLGPDREDGDWSEALAALLRDLHTLKGTSSTYGFESIARVSREAEDALVDGGRDSSGKPFGITAMPELLVRLTAALEEIRDLSRRLSGHSEMAALPVPEHKLRHLRSLSDAVELYHRGAAPEPVSMLLRACRSLDHMALGKLTEKYQIMLERVAHRLGKRIVFLATPEGLEMSPQAFAALDEPLVHLLRNAADHGIEAEGQRLLAGKDPIGHIQLELEPREDRLLIMVSDDGKGIEVEKVVAKAASLGLVEETRLSSMSEEEKLGLIFASGLSTRDHDNDISGRGVGMDAVAAWAKGAGGRITISSEPGKGTKMTLHLPPRFKTEEG